MNYLLKASALVKIKKQIEKYRALILKFEKSQDSHRCSVDSVELYGRKIANCIQTIDKLKLVHNRANPTYKIDSLINKYYERIEAFREAKADPAERNELSVVECDYQVELCEKMISELEYIRGDNGSNLQKIETRYIERLKLFKAQISPCLYFQKFSPPNQPFAVDESQKWERMFRDKIQELEFHETSIILSVEDNQLQCRLFSEREVVELNDFFKTTGDGELVSLIQSCFEITYSPKHSSPLRSFTPHFDDRSTSPTLLPRSASNIALSEQIENSIFPTGDIRILPSFEDLSINPSKPPSSSLSPRLNK